MMLRLLRRDPLCVALLPLLVVVAAATSALGPWVLKTVDLIAGSITSGGSAIDFSDLYRAAMGMVALQVMLLSTTMAGSWSRRVDGVQPLTRALPMDLLLPIAPRSLWSARLVAQLLLLALPLLVAAIVLKALGQTQGLAAFWKVGAATAALIFMIFGLAPARPAVVRKRDKAWVSVAAFAALGLLGYDLGAFTDEAISSRRFAVECALAASMLWAARGYGLLPLSWSLPQASKTADMVRDELDLPDSPAAALPVRLLVPWSTLWTPQALALCSMGVIIAPVYGSLAAPWVVVVCSAALIVAGAQRVLSGMQFLAALPVSRRQLLLVLIVPTVITLSLGGLIAKGWADYQHSERPAVTLDNELERLPADGSGQKRFDGWVDVIVPLRHWRLAPGGVVPLQAGPGGESVRPRAVHPLGLSFLTVYNPFDAPKGSSQAFTAWQFSRALQAEYGVQLEADELSERYLDTQRDGRVAISHKQVSHNLDHQEAEEGEWYGSMGTLTADYPELVSSWDGRRAALWVLAVSALAALFSMMFFRLRQGGRSAKVVSSTVQGLLMMLFAVDMWLKIGFEQSHPQVLFAVLGEALMSWLPASTVMVWAITGAFATVAFMVMARALDLAEVVVQGDKAAKGGS